MPSVSKIEERTYTRFKSYPNLPTHSRTSSYHDLSGVTNDATDSSSPSATSTSESNQPDKAASQPSRLNSSDDVHAKFMPTDWEGKFSSDANFFTPVPGASAGRSTRARSSPARRATPPRSGNKEPNPSGLQGGTQHAPTPFAEAKFSADKWSEALFKEAFVPPDEIARSNQVNRDRGKSPKKGARVTLKRTTVPKPASVVGENTPESQATYATTEKASHAADESVVPEAMDLDESPTPDQQKQRSQTEPRTYNVDINRPVFESKAKPEPDNQAKENNTKIKTPLNLDELQNIAPFTSTNHDGLGDLQDLSTTLPFPSQASNGIKASNDSVEKPFRLPHPPQAPVAPLRNCNLNNWERYIGEMGGYMWEWNKFSNKMLRYFNERQVTFETGLNPRWISCVGDGGDVTATDNVLLAKDTQQGGYAAYSAMLEEDHFARLHWDDANNKHRVCIQKLGEVREKVRDLQLKGKLK